jgi:polygalacturonase
VLKQNETRRSFMKGAAALTGVVVGGERAVADENSRPKKRQSSFDVTRFGAKGDGSTLDSPAINKAIEAAADAGGGAVIFPAGTYRCFSIHLKSHVSLVLSDGSIIIGADSPANPGEQGYDLAEPNEQWERYQDYGHGHFHNSLIWGEDLSNISIYGPGLIWGKGLSRGEGAGPIAEKPGVANKAIALKNCHNVLFRDFSILHGGHFGILATGVDNLTIENLMIDTQRDGMDIDCCKNVRISGCSVNSPWDDAICLKSSFALGSARSTEMVTISDCYVTGIYEEGSLIDGTYRRFPESAEVDRNGRIKLGTESNGGFKNIAISNCVFDGCFGLAIISVDGAVVEDITIANIAMRNIIGAPIFVRLGSRMRAPEGTPVGTIRRISISDIVCSETNSQACSLIIGVPGHAVEDIQLSNIVVLHPGGGTMQDAALDLPENEKDYPEPTMFGITPAHGFYIRHARGIEMNQIKIKIDKHEDRPCFILKDVQDATFVQMKLPHELDRPILVLDDVQQITILQSKPIPDIEIDEAKHRIL